MNREGVDVSIVVAAYDMQREIVRTVRSLSVPYQVGVASVRAEIIVADNGSAVPVEPSWFGDVSADVRVLRFAPGNPSPCAALNAAVDAARAPLIAVLIDGARLVSPGFLARALEATRTANDAFIATMGFHLGPETQQRSQLSGYCAQVEDRLLDAIGWPHDGYRLFEICARAESYRDGVLSNFPETAGFVMRRASFARIGGYDERFRSAGGGLASFDFYERALDDAAIEPIVLVGEGTFHQVHGGVSTRAGGVGRRDVAGGPTIWEEMATEFERLTGRPPLSRRLRKPALYGRCETEAAERCFFAAQSDAGANPSPHDTP